MKIFPMHSDIRHHVPRRTAFTLVEMLVAMAISLLLMAALAKAFNVIGVTMRESRSRVEMSGQLRTVGFRLNDELRRCTALMKPPQSSDAGAGYFVYYDGPVTDATFLLSDFEGPQAGVEGATDYRPRSKYGDYDDYLAFTAVADGNSYFTGIVPRFVVEARQAELLGTPYVPDPATALDRVVIQSKYAEIIYWVAPLRVTTPGPAFGSIVDTDLNAVNATGAAISDGLPDQLRLHRRVLLIRPDLNLEATGRVATLPPAISLAMQIRNTTGSPRGPDPGWPENWRDIRSVYQDCDLSIRRPLNAGGLPYPITPAAAGADDDLNGNAADDHGVVANSLGDLTLPQNRFGHVRVPAGTPPFPGGTAGFTSMPLLDLSGADAYLSSRNPPTTRSVPPLTSGFLNAIYELADDRLGEDIVLTGVLGFDVRAFDPLAPVILHVGPDGAPGSSGTLIGNFGAVGSDDLVLTPADPGFGDAMESAPWTGPGTGTWTLASQGAFVDLDYVYKRGGAIRADASNTDDSNAMETVFESNLEAQCSTPFSGFDVSIVRPTPWRFPLSYAKSGRVLPGIFNTAGPLFYQPAYDTWASDYEADGFNQGTVGTLAGTVWATTAGTTVPWDTGPNMIADEGNNGIDEGGAPGADDPGEYETSPPYFEPLRAIQIRLRVEDTVTRQVRQMIVTEEFVD